MTIRIIEADVMDGLAQLEDGSVHCVVTSPPYWGLRDYGTATWEGGEAECDHAPDKRGSRFATPVSTKQGSNTGSGTASRRDCDCGAVRIDAQIGLEPTPEAYVERMVAVFREVRRVLRDDGTVWLNLGDSYATGNTSQASNEHPSRRQKGTGLTNGIRPSRPAGNLKPKDLCGIPWLTAKALQAPYYAGRLKAERDRVWLAATIDAEGTICGFDHDRSDGGGHRSGVHMAITNSSMAMLDEAQRIWPTSRSEHGRPGPGHLGQRPTWRWIVHGVENKMAALREIYPHLIVKRQQAVAAYSLLLLMADAKRLGKSGQKDAVAAKRRVLTGLLSDLNQDRPYVLPDWLTEPPTLYEPGWYLRAEIVWSKPNPMPESVTDRPTRAHEYVFLLSKRARYYYDADAIREPIAPSTAGDGRLWRDGYTTGRPERGYPGSASNGAGLLQPDPAGRNKRTVWEIPTQPFPGAHFATFPEALVKPCIQAGTSEWGCCPECGAPWQRVTERESSSRRREGYTAHGQHEGTLRNDDGVGGPGSGALTPSIHTTGWRPTCKCAPCGGSCCDNPCLLPVANADSSEWVCDCACHPMMPVPCVVLDPFAGSGTVGVVAQKAGRKAVLIDVNPEYCAMMRDRLAQRALL